MTRTSVADQLVRLLHVDGIPDPSQAPVTDEAWDGLVIAAIALGLAPALHLATGNWVLPPRARAKLAVTYAASQSRNEAIAGQLAELLAAFRGAGLDVLVLKGAYLAFQVYPDPALRGMSDIDLLFRPADLSRAEAVLQALGYRGKYKPAEQGPGIVKHTSTYKRETLPAQPGETPNPYLSASGDRHVDPHGSLEEAWFGLRVDVTPGVWERSRPITLAGQPARAQSAEDLLLHLGVHLVFHLLMGKPSLVQLYDLAIVCRHLELNWDEVIGLCRERRASPFVLAALHLAQTSFAAPVPVAVLEALRQSCPQPLARYIDGLSLGDVMRKTQQPPLVTVRQRLARGIRDRKQTARWALTWRDKWAVWRTALAIGQTDTARLIGQSLRARLRLQSRIT